MANITDLKNKKMYIYIGSIILCLIVITIIVLVNINKDNNQGNMGQEFSENIENSESIILEEASTAIGKKVNELEEYNDVNETETEIETGAETLQVKVEEEVSENTINEEAELSNNEIEENIEEVNSNEVVNNEENVAKVEEVVEEPTFIKPVEGEIIKHYGKEKLIYSDTLKEWTTHLGIDIKADKTTIVKSASDGIVKSIKNDPRYGLTVVIEHNCGFVSVYSNLLTAEFVVVGENVKSGQTIGTVGNSATFEILDEPHLHFEILKDGNSVDPEMYIK